MSNIVNRGQSSESDTQPLLLKYCDSYVCTCTHKCTIYTVGTYTMSNSRVSSLAWAERIEPNVQRRHVCIYLFANNLWARVSGIIIYVERSHDANTGISTGRMKLHTYTYSRSRQNYCGIGAVLQGRLLQLFPALLTDSCLLFTKISSHRLQFFYQKS